MPEPLAIIGVLKNLVTAVGQIRDAEIRNPLIQQIIDLQGMVLEQQSDMLKLQEENASLRGRLASRDETADPRKRLFYARNAYWLRDDTENKAYCTGCFDDKGKLVLLAHVGDGFAHCPVCDQRYLHVY